MREVDNLVERNEEALTLVMEQALAFKNASEGALTAGIDALERDDRDDQVLLFEERYEKSWKLVKSNQAHEIKYSNDEHAIDNVVCMRHLVKVIQELGGVMQKHWGIKFRRKAYKKDIMYAKL
ncbi:hypothetical protein BGX26_004428 [Mortierella sp. AD094]|nr:hypothetical protein BGX26_004428 [Mortierella sp. AD094]